MTKEEIERAKNILLHIHDMKPFLVDDETYESQNESLKVAIKALQKPNEKMIEDFIKQKIDYHENLASIETNEGRWVEGEKYYYAISVLEEIVEYINTSGDGEE